MVEPATAYLVITLLALVTLATRLSGAFLMRFVTLSPRVSVFLDAMSASVLAAIVVTFLVNNESREIAAVAFAMLIMFVTRSAVWAMLGAMALAAGWSWILG